MNGDELKKILCLLEPGMILTVPDVWIDRTIAGPIARQVTRIKEISHAFGCVWRQDNGVQSFEKLEVPFTG